MTKTVTMRVGRKCKTDKMRRYNLMLDEALIADMQRKVKRGKLSAWARGVLHEAVSK